MTAFICRQEGQLDLIDLNKFTVKLEFMSECFIFMMLVIKLFNAVILAFWK